MPHPFSTSRVPSQLPAMGSSATHRLSHAPGGGSSAGARAGASAHRIGTRRATAIVRSAGRERRWANIVASLTDRPGEGQLSRAQTSAGVHRVRRRAHRLQGNRVIFLRGRAGIPRRGPDRRAHVSHPSVARRYARFVLGLTGADIPGPVTAKAAALMLDTLGSCLASSREDFGRAVLDSAERLGGPQESTLIGTKAKAGAASAALANATLAHGLDFDDTREGAIVHTGCVAVTTALAVGEAVGASGRAVLEATIAGGEVMCRVGLAVPGRFHARHFHPTSLTGSFAAAAVASPLYHLTEDQLVHAFGICGRQAGAVIEYLADGSWTKRPHPAWAGHARVA